jgi:peptidoglycan/xylan/chitin deacetylase (PgdA/CDA1 family)
MVGRQLAQPAAQAIALDIHADPLFRVANHTDTHPHLPQLELASVEAEVARATAALQLALRDPCYYSSFFRFPFTEASCDTVEVVRARGMAVAGMHIDTLDWCYARQNGHCPAESAPWLPAAYREDMVGFVLSQFARYQGGIVLMHDIHPNTVAMLPSVIAALRAAGATFVALDDATVFPRLNAEIERPDPPACCANLTP